MKPRDHSLRFCLHAAIGLLLLTFPLFQAELGAQSQVVKEAGITFAQAGDVELKLDVARPAQGKGPFPAMLFIHGGSWTIGTRKDYSYVVEKVAEKGYVGVTVDYRLIDDLESEKTRNPFPAQLHDVKQAVRWMRANAEKYRIDPEHIGVLGFSAGAHLALLLALTRPSDDLEGPDADARYSTAVQAVVSCAGPASVDFLSDAPVMKRLMGGTIQEVPELYRKASPVTYVRRDGPPALIFHGDKDDLVPLAQAQLLDARMTEVGAPHALIVKKGAGHQSFHEEKAVWDFLDRNLKPSWWNRVLRWFGKK